MGGDGMLWYDNDPRSTLAAKIQKAMQYFREKYKHNVEYVLVSPSVDGSLEELSKTLGVPVRPWRSITPGHLWIGFEVQMGEAASA
jgi:hypothetical protein